MLDSLEKPEHFDFSEPALAMLPEENRPFARRYLRAKKRGEPEQKFIGREFLRYLIRPPRVNPNEWTPMEIIIFVIFIAFIVTVAALGGYYYCEDWKQ